MSPARRQTLVSAATSAGPRPVRQMITTILVTTLAVISQPSIGLSQELSMPGPLEEVGFDQRLGEDVPLDAEFMDESGNPVQLGDYFGDKPVVLTLAYYDCPMLCSLVLNAMTSTLGVLTFDAGEDYEVVVVSFDSRETPALAAEARATYLERYDRPGTESGWHFLTGNEESIRRLTESVGFRYVWVPESDQFAHASGILALTPDGKISRYFYGIEYAPRDVRLGLIEAADHRIGTVVDQVLLYCFRYDPVAGKYSAVAMNMVRVAAAATLLALGTFMIFHLRRDRKRNLSRAKA